MLYDFLWSDPDPEPEPDPDPENLTGSGSEKKVRIRPDPDPQHWYRFYFRPLWTEMLSTLSVFAEDRLGSTRVEKQMLLTSFLLWCVKTYHT